jgi:hypothetical protein
LKNQFKNDFAIYERPDRCYILFKSLNQYIILFNEFNNYMHFEVLVWIISQNDKFIKSESICWNVTLISSSQYEVQYIENVFPLFKCENTQNGRELEREFMNNFKLEVANIKKNGMKVQNQNFSIWTVWGSDYAAVTKRSNPLRKCGTFSRRLRKYNPNPKYFYFTHNSSTHLQTNANYWWFLFHQ